MTICLLNILAAVVVGLNVRAGNYGVAAGLALFVILDLLTDIRDKK